MNDYQKKDLLLQALNNQGDGRPFVFQNHRDSLQYKELSQMNEQ